MKELKTHYVKTKMSKKLFVDFTKYCNSKNISKSRFMRNSIKYFLNTENNEKIYDKDQKFKKQVMYEIHRYGNNLNQIAYKLNVALKSNNLSYYDKLDVKTAINDLNKLSQDIIDLRHLISERL